MYVFLRHAEKRHTNKCGGFDSPITIKGRCDAFRRFHMFSREYGVPSKIVASPFLRTRQTASIASKVFNIEYTIEPKVSEYTGYHPAERVRSGLSAKTLALGALISNEEDFKIQITEYIRDVRECDGITLVISHSHTIYTLAALLGKSITHPSNLEGISVDFNTREVQLI